MNEFTALFRRLFSSLCLAAGLQAAPLLFPDTAAAQEGAAQHWQAGVAIADITPWEPIWMAGYTARNRPSEGVDQNLYAKALALESEAGGRMVIVTMDLIGVQPTTRAHVERAAAGRFGLKPEEVLLNASHTHCGPDLTAGEHEQPLINEENAAVVRRYRAWLDERLVDLVGEALADLAPASLRYGQARAGFAMNRRRPEPDGRISNNPNPWGSVDHRVPVLRVDDPASGELRAVLFGYACHTTSLGYYRINGDYAGYAQEYIQEAFPEAIALFMAGCGGDQNPYPRRDVVPGQTALDLAKQHGRTLANAVFTALLADSDPVRGPLRSALGHAHLEYRLTSRAELQQRLDAGESTAEGWLEVLERGELPKCFPWPIQVVQFGNSLTLVALGGEPVVDYALRLKRELPGPARVWVAGYTERVGYLGTRRVLEEGGYEGYRANLSRPDAWIPHPGPFAYSAEEAVVRKVFELWSLVNKQE